MIDQGEGATPETEGSHWDKLTKILEGFPNGRKLACYPVVENPVTSTFKESAPKVYKVGVIDGYAVKISLTRFSQLMLFSDAVVRIHSRVYRMIR